MIKMLKFVCGISLLVFGIGGATGVYRSSGAIKPMVIDRRPVVCPVRGGELKVPGRLVAAILFGVPIVSLLAAWSVLSSALHDSDKNQN